MYTQQQAHKARVQNFDRRRNGFYACRVNETESSLGSEGERDGCVCESSQSELDNVYWLDTNLFLPYTYDELKSQTLTKEHSHPSLVLILYALTAAGKSMRGNRHFCHCIIKPIFTSLVHLIDLY